MLVVHQPQLHSSNFNQAAQPGEQGVPSRLSFLSGENWCSETFIVSLGASFFFLVPLLVLAQIWQETLLAPIFLYDVVCNMDGSFAGLGVGDRECLR